MSSAKLNISPSANVIDTNCTGCNAINSQGVAVQQFSATLVGSSESVTWSVSGGDALSGPGTINSNGQYTPPSFLSADQVVVTVTAQLDADHKSSTTVTVVPGFLQPLTPENAAIGAGGSVTISGYLAEAGGSAGIKFALANTATGSSGGLGSLSATTCQRGASTFTTCSATYTAPATISGTGLTYVVATAGNFSAKTAAGLLLNTAGVTSNPATHQAQLSSPIQLGTSGGNNRDYDTRNNTVVDCCGGTLGSLVQDSSGRRFVLSNNHVLARSDRASAGDVIVQPALIDNNCTPNGDGPGTTQVAALTNWLPLSSNATNADAAIAQVASGEVDANGRILELGARQSDGTLASAPPGTSSSGGKGEKASLSLQVAKSGRTTALTCSAISATNLDVKVDYYQDCAETKSYLTKTYTNQMAISGNHFSDAGDSGSLVVDTANAEPVGLLFAGGVDVNGVSQAVANPVSDVLNELSAQSNGTSYRFVGTADHAVNCLNYNNNTVVAAKTGALSAAELARARQGLAQARSLVGTSTGILSVAAGASGDHPGEAAVIVYVDQAANATVPAIIGGLRTVVIPTTSRAVASAALPLAPARSALPSQVISQAVVIKQQLASTLMQQNPAFFGVGVGQSLDNPKEAALVIYVNRKQLPAELPQTIDGMRTQYVVMDRLHVTRSYAGKIPARSRCMAHSVVPKPANQDLLAPLKPKPFHFW